jgi:cytochrome P450
MAFMQEILRLFTPLVHLAKQNPSAQTIQTSTGTYWLPANVSIYINTIALHADRNIWHHLNLRDGEKGTEDDVWLFRPGRWINPPGSQQPLFQPPKGSYVPWSTGPRICPGQKMSQVEFVSVFLTLLRRHRIDAVPLPGESRLDVEKRLDQRMRNSISILTLQMDSVYDVSGSGKGLMLQLSKR